MSCHVYSKSYDGLPISSKLQVSASWCMYFIEMRQMNEWLERRKSKLWFGKWPSVMQSVHDLQLMDWITQSYSFGPLMVQYKKILWHRFIMIAQKFILSEIFLKQRDTASQSHPEDHARVMLTCFKLGVFPAVSQQHSGSHVINQHNEA